MPLTPAHARAHADEVRETSVTILRGLIPTDVIDTWNTAFGPLLANAVRREGGNPNRGPHRYYVTLPFHGLWADPTIIDNDAILAVVEPLVGADGVVCELAADTPLLGSEHQALHRDGAQSPPPLAVNVPLVDVTDETGPLEYAPGTHLLSTDEGMRRIEAGEIPLVKGYMRRGDVMIRDVRHIHRGTPNRTSMPRPMVVVGYSRGRPHRPEVNVRIPAGVLLALPERARRWLRHNPVVESRAEVARPEEICRAFAD